MYPILSQWDAPFLCKEPLFGNIVQLLYNENLNRLSCRCNAHHER
jgi:hypothetical protein